MIRFEKLFFVVIALLCSSIVFFVSCSDKTDANKEDSSDARSKSINSKNVTLIPKDAPVVACINLSKIAEKGDLKNIKQLSSYQYVGMIPGEAKSLFEEFVDNPDICGINFNEDIVAYPADLYFETFVAVSPLSDREKFEKFADQVLGKKPKKQDDYYMISEGDVLLAWDDCKLLAVIGDDNKSVAEKIMKLDGDNSMASNSNFNEFWSKRGDVSIYADVDNIMGNALVSMAIQEELARNNVPQKYIDDLSHGSLFANLSFESGNVNLHVERINVGNSLISGAFNQSFNADLLKYMPEDPISAATFSVNASYIMNMIRDIQPDALSEHFNDQLTIEDLVKCFKGSFASALVGFDNENPIYVMAADIDNSSMVDAALSYTLSKDSKTGYYQAEDYYIAVKDNAIIVSNKPSIITTTASGLRECADKAKSGCYMYCNLDANNIAGPFKKDMNSDMINLWNSLFKSLEVNSSGNNAIDIVLNIPSGNENSLSYLIKFIDKNNENIFNVIQDLYMPMYAYGY